MRRLWTSVFLGITLALPVKADSGATAWPDCYCTDKAGTRQELGTVLCLSVGGRSFMARCEMALNNPFWREVEDSCLFSDALPQTPIPKV